MARNTANKIELMVISDRLRLLQRLRQANFIMRFMVLKVERSKCLNVEMSNGLNVKWSECLNVKRSKMSKMSKCLMV